MKYGIISDLHLNNKNKINDSTFKTDNESYTWIKSQLDTVDMLIINGDIFEFQ